MSYRRLNADFGIEDVSTVGGLVYALFDRVPKSGESLVHADFESSWNACIDVASSACTSSGWRRDGAGGRRFSAFR
jgi:CBS domain containing-hemolysin-like protein